jgi:hypothetical protein
MGDCADYYEESGFAALGQHNKPERNNPRDWLVWHFTHVGNLAAIADSGCLRCPSQQDPVVNVALRDIKVRRARIAVKPDPDYPASKSVSDHVPFYVATKSPMLYTVTRGHKEYSGGADDLVFLGLSIGNLVDAGVIWCASDANAAASSVGFSREVDSLAEHLDFDLLCQEWWGKTPEDPHRPSRRAAEILVLEQVPLAMIGYVVAKNEITLERARTALQRDGHNRHYRVLPGFYFD